MNWKKALPVLGLILFLGLIWKVQPQKIWAAVVRVRWEELVFLPVMVVGVLGLQTLKWKAILRRQGYRIPFPRLLTIQLMSQFYGTVTPGRVGGLVKILYLSKSSKISLAESSSSVLLDRFLDAMALFSLASAGAVLLTDRLGDMFLVLLSALGLAMALFVIFYNVKNSRFVLEKIFMPLSPENLKTRLRTAFEGFFRSLPGKKRDLAVPAVLTALTWVLMFSQNYLVGRSLGMHIPFFVFVFISAIGAVAGLAPVTINGLGTREAVLVFLFSLYNVPAAMIIGMSLISLVLCTFVPALGGGALALRDFKSVHKN